MDEQKIKVVFIGGCGRSGTTLLDLMLGQNPSCFSLGEVYHIWKRGFIENQLCGCGVPFRSCNFWQSVIEEASGTMDLSFVPSILRLERSVSRFRYLPFLAWPSLRSTAFDAKVRQYASTLESLYGAIAKVSGRNVLVDSSKLAVHGLVLSEISDIELFVIHVVRDGPAVIYSWQRKRPRPEIFWKQSFMPRSGLIKGIQVWLLANFSVQLLSKRRCRYKILNYEKLTDQPRKEVGRIMEWLELKTQPETFVNDYTIDLGVNHTVSGNPLRFKRGMTKIRTDMEWQYKMPKAKQQIIHALTSFLFGHFQQDMR